MKDRNRLPFARTAAVWAADEARGVCEARTRLEACRTHYAAEPRGLRSSCNFKSWKPDKSMLSSCTEKVDSSVKRIEVSSADTKLLVLLVSTVPQGDYVQASIAH